MTPEDRKKIQTWADALTPAGCKIILNAREGPTAELLKNFSEALGGLAPELTIRRNPDDAFCEPALIVGPHANIAFQALPAGPELDPFLDALAAGSHSSDLLAPGALALVQQLTHPTDLVLYIAAQCPHCPNTVRRLWPLAAASPKIRLTIVDAALFESRATDHGVLSVPLLIMDDQFRWSGLPDLVEILTICLDRDPKVMSDDSLRQIIEAGDAGNAAQMMIDCGDIFPALIRLLAYEKWSVRLGAMVTVEYLADEAPGLADRIIEPLWKNFKGFDTQVQGDVAHVLGSIGSEKARLCLKEIVAGSFDEEVVEAAREALA